MTARHAVGQASSPIVRHQVALMLGASVAIGSVVTIAASRLSSNPALLPLIALPVAFVPSVIAAVVSRRAGTAAERSAFRGRVTRIRAGWRWYAAAAVLPAMHLGAVALAPVFAGKVTFHPEMLAILPLFLLTSLGEEIGWRGYARSKLQETWSPLAASLIVGVAWAAFHWVAVSGNSDAPLAWIAVSSALLVAMSVLLGQLFDGAGQVVAVAVFAHALYDTVSISVAPLIETGVPLAVFTLSAAIAWLVVGGLVLSQRRTRSATTPALIAEPTA